MDTEGETVAHMIYDPWGSPLIETYADTNLSGLENLNKFTGYTWDETLGLYFAQNRFYDPEVHRFTQEDVIKDGSNWYVYCGNSPLVYVDPEGEKTYALGAEFAAAVGLRIAEGRQIVLDDAGNIGLIHYGGLGIGSPSISASIVLTFTSAPTIDSLTGVGFAVGGSVTTSFYGLGIGAEYNEGENLYGGTLSLGVGLPELHAEATSATITSKNAWWLKPVYKTLFKIAEHYYNKLDCEIKRQLESN